MKNSLAKNKSFLLLIAGKAISFLGTQIQDFALSLYVLKITGSATKFAGVLAVTVLPQIILGPLCGVFADWYDRKKIMIILDIISGLVVASMALTYKMNGELNITYIYIAVILLSVASLLYGASAGAVLPSIVKKEELLNANSINGAVNAIVQIASPIIAGIMYSFLGLVPVIIFNSVSFFLSAIFEFIMTIPKIQRDNISFNYTQFKKDFKEGIVFIKSKKLILKITICAFIINFAVAPVFSVGFTYIFKRVLFVPDATFGVISSVISLGTLIGSLLAGLVGKKMDMSKAFALGITLCGILSLFISLVLLMFNNKYITNISIMIIMLTVLIITIIAAIIIVNILLSTMFQRETPKEIMGRAGSVLSTVCSIGVPAGQLIIGGMFDYAPSYVPMTIAAAALIITGLGFSISEKKNKDFSKNYETKPL